MDQVTINLPFNLKDLVVALGPLVAQNPVLNLIGLVLDKSITFEVIVPEEEKETA